MDEVIPHGSYFVCRCCGALSHHGHSLAHVGIAKNKMLRENVFMIVVWYVVHSSSGLYGLLSPFQSLGDLV